VVGEELTPTRVLGGGRDGRRFYDETGGQYRGDPHILENIEVPSPRQYLNLAKEGYEHACRYFSLTEPSR
jgi:hypothetical protein